MPKDGAEVLHAGGNRAHAKRGQAGQPWVVTSGSVFQVFEHPLGPVEGQDSRLVQGPGGGAIKVLAADEHLSAHNRVL